MTEYELTASELHLVKSAIGNAGAQNVADMIGKHKLFTAFEFTDEEKAAIAWQETANPDGSMSWRFSAQVMLKRELSESQRRKLLSILEQTVQNLRVNAWPMFMGVMLKLGYVLPEG